MPCIVGPMIGPKIRAIRKFSRERENRFKISSVNARPETWVTERSGHIGNTFRFAGGVDAVERGVQSGGASTFRRPSSGWGMYECRLPGVRDLAQDRL